MSAKTDLRVSKDAFLIIRINSRIKSAITELATRNKETLTDKVTDLITRELKQEGVRIEVTKTIA